MISYYAFIHMPEFFELRYSIIVGKFFIYSIFCLCFAFFFAVRDLYPLTKNKTLLYCICARLFLRDISQCSQVRDGLHEWHCVTVIEQRLLYSYSYGGEGWQRYSIFQSVRIATALLRRRIYKRHFYSFLVSFYSSTLSLFVMYHG
ncbi:hypothetical protein ABID23_000442 [Bartonella silvatica]|uniref:Uncharacterized protein n=1 Tax=Bartonella silvatica TaxID=357760 RepID=A0ABV2HFP3_9HYPH